MKTGDYPEAIQSLLRQLEYLLEFAPALCEVLAPWGPDNDTSDWVVDIAPAPGRCPELADMGGPGDLVHEPLRIDLLALFNLLGPKRAFFTGGSGLYLQGKHGGHGVSLHVSSEPWDRERPRYVLDLRTNTKVYLPSAEGPDGD